MQDKKLAFVFINLSVIRKLFVALLFSIAIDSCNHHESQPAKTAMKENTFNLDSLLSATDTTAIIIAIDDHINASLISDETLEGLTQAQKNFYYIQELEREVNNGGFDQYFYNSSGDYAHETISALQAIGAEKAMKILQSAINEFPDHLVPKDRTTRQEILSKMEGKAQLNWQKLDDEFYTYPDDLSELNIEYVRKNKKDFER